MRRKEIEDKLYADFVPLVKAEGAELLDVDLTSENKVSYLRVAIFHPDGVSLDLCATVQRVLSDALDRDDPIAGSYTLEVSSPGLERTLRRPKEFEVFRGRQVAVTLFRAEKGKKVFEGKLSALRAEKATVPNK